MPVKQALAALVHAGSGIASNQHLFKRPPIDAAKQLRVAATVNQQAFMLRRQGELRQQFGAEQGRRRTPCRPTWRSALAERLAKTESPPRHPQPLAISQIHL
ncbi:hypothetical protein PY365_21195 [Roseiarcaceae bacterium H3SJ34-1]|uniref:hypothetical protein n=1 Tax=Terripilifer ovatus TaxID=3032367 RepID=UPI003AB91AAA|nr:hypothetical protein [Roseiarcaceae bacterium H3SJ34-1]